MPQQHANSQGHIGAMIMMMILLIMKIMSVSLVGKPEHSEETTGLRQVTDNLSHIQMSACAQPQNRKPQGCEARLATAHRGVKPD